MTSSIGILKANLSSASNGLEAYEIAACQNFDLIIMDLNMPIMDGFKATKKIKDYFRNSNIFMGGDFNSDDEDNDRSLRTEPIIVALSASELDQQLTQQCKDSGFDHWMSSPLNCQALKHDVIDRIL